MAEQLATLVLTVDSYIYVNESITFTTNQTGATSVTETCRTVRTGSNEFTLDGDDDTYIQAGYIYDAFRADYDSYFDISSDSDTITIVAKTSDISFSDISVPANMSYTYTVNIEPDPEFEITGITAESATDTDNRNTKARFNVSVENGTSPYTLNIMVENTVIDSKTADTEDDLYTDYLRQPSTSPYVVVYDNDGNSSSYDLPTVDSFSLDSVTTSGDTATAIITVESGEISTTREYSLDNDTYQSSPSYSSLTAGDYTMYVRDDFGALYSLSFSIVSTDIVPDPVFIIEKINPIRFVERQDYDGDNPPTLRNTLFSDYQDYLGGNIQKQYYAQPITDYDSITTQIKTTYTNVEVSIKDNDENVVLEPTATEKLTYISQEDMRDAVIMQTTDSDNDGKTFLYFVSGNTYDPDTEESTGSYSNSTNKVYSFAKNANYFVISGTDSMDGTYEMIKVSFEEVDDDGTTYYGILLDAAFNGDDYQTCVVKTEYDEEDYNVWEFTFSGGSLDEGYYSMEVYGYASDDGYEDYDDIYFDSECFQKVSGISNTHIFKASHSENTSGIDFDTGITLNLRVNGRLAIPTFTEEDDDFTTDEGLKVVLKSVVSTIIRFESMLIPWYIVERLAIMSGFDSLTIDGVSYIKDEDTEDESKDDDMNLMRILTRNYIEDVTTITDEVGLTTDSISVLGTEDTTVIGLE